MLQDDAQRHLRAGLDQPFGSIGRYLERFFQKDVLARRGELLDQLEVRVRRREDQDSIDRTILEDRLDTIALGKWKPGRELCPAGSRRAIGVRNFNLQVDQALGV